jgi:copper chaperone CopZ
VTVEFVVSEAGCEACAALVRDALEPFGTVESVEIDADADEATVWLDASASEEAVNGALADASAGAGHAYRVRPGSWRAADSARD